MNMEMNINNLKKSEGFSVVALVLAIGVFCVLITSWAFSGATNITPLSANIHAGLIIDDGRQIKLAYDSLLVSGVPEDSILFVPNSTNAFNVLNPMTGVNWPKTNPAALEPNLSFPFGYWIYNPNKLIGNNIGTGAADPAVLIQGINEVVCKRINYNLHGSEYVPSFGFSGNTAILVANSTMGYPLTNIANQQYALGGTSGWMNGCVKVGAAPNGANNYYFQILKPK